MHTQIEVKSSIQVAVYMQLVIRCGKVIIGQMSSCMVICVAAIRAGELLLSLDLDLKLMTL